MQRVAVTGCAGSFATTLLPLFEADPEIEQIVGIDRVPPVGKYEKLRFYQYDIREPQIRQALAGCDVLLHLALSWYVHRDSTMEAFAATVKALIK